MIDLSDDDENVDDSIRFNCEFDSNVIDGSDLQNEKQFELRISTFRGIMIDLNDDDENADDSISFNCEFASNAIDESNPEYEKQSDPITSKSLAISIFDENKTFQIDENKSFFDKKCRLKTLKSRGIQI
jgi:hypothetical protein